MKLLDAIDLCRQHQLVTPCLLLLYATIDINSSLDRDAAHQDVQRSDFLRWVNTYLLPDPALQCSAVDLYAARCSLLHTYSAESRLSREGEAVQVWYAWGNRSADELQQAIDTRGTAAVAVHVDGLIAALRKGIEQFLITIESDPARDALVTQRLRQVLVNVSP